jgi:hypothetical protein
MDDVSVRELGMLLTATARPTAVDRVTYRFVSDYFGDVEMFYLTRKI